MPCKNFTLYQPPTHYVKKLKNLIKFFLLSSLCLSFACQTKKIASTETNDEIQKTQKASAPEQAEHISTRQRVYSLVDLTENKSTKESNETQIEELETDESTVPTSQGSTNQEEKTDQKDPSSKTIVPIIVGAVGASALVVGTLGVLGKKMANKKPRLVITKRSGVVTNFKLETPFLGKKIGNSQVGVQRLNQEIDIISISSLREIEIIGEETVYVVIKKDHPLIKDKNNSFVENGKEYKQIHEQDNYVLYDVREVKTSEFDPIGSRSAFSRKTSNEALTAKYEKKTGVIHKPTVKKEQELDQSLGLELKNIPLAVGSNGHLPPPYASWSYQVTKELGKGNFGSVVQVQLQHPKFGEKLFAIKSMDFRPETKLSIYKEMEILEEFNKAPHHLGYFGAFKSADERKINLVMEHMASTLERKIFDPNLAREMTRGIKEMHTRGISHFDLKPENIFLDKDGHVRIGDLGAADTSSVAFKELKASSMFYTIPKKQAFTEIVLELMQNPDIAPEVAKMQQQIIQEKFPGTPSVNGMHVLQNQQQLLEFNAEFDKRLTHLLTEKFPNYLAAQRQNGRSLRNMTFDPRQHDVYGLGMIWFEMKKIAPNNVTREDFFQQALVPQILDRRLAQDSKASEQLAAFSEYCRSQLNRSDPYEALIADMISSNPPDILVVEARLKAIQTI